MCDQDHFDEDVKKYSRRDLGVMVSAGIGAALMLPRSAHAVDVAENDVELRTGSGMTARSGMRKVGIEGRS